uniref:glutathione transferase n=1 Tax=Panagrellus redivivus TaxID=6233 RepID=A0A7E4ZZD3_PANRE
MMLHYVGQPYEDVFVQLSDWENIKKTMPQESLPILEVDGKKMPQTKAILRYLGRVYDLTGRNHFERGVIDSISELFGDLFMQIMPWLTVAAANEDKVAIATLRKERLQPAIETKFHLFTAYLEDSKSGYYAHSGLTYVDFLSAFIFGAIYECEPDVFEDFPLILEHLNRVHKLPGVYEYVMERDTSAL